MLVCNVSYVPPRTISAAIAEAVTARDATRTGNDVFATLLDDPASVVDVIDALLGEIVLEAANATDTFGAAGSVYTGAVDEAASAADVIAIAGAITSAAVAEAATATDVPDAAITGAPAMTTTSTIGPLREFDPTFTSSSLTVIDVGR